eukprot:3799711-Pyramimonas_sp.AAC.1
MQRSKPHLSGSMSALCDFVRKWSGGESRPYLIDVEAWSKTLKNRRLVSSQTLKFLADLEYASGPEYPTACFKACLVAPDNFVENNVARLLTNTDIQTVFGSNAAKVATFVTMDRAAKRWMHEL